jgi:hypothetical protein
MTRALLNTGGAPFPAVDEESSVQDTVTSLAGWENFYVIVGSSAAALTGLMFVVVALIAERRTPSFGPAVSAFGTPTVVHFCATLLVSALISAPWHRLSSLALVFVGCGTVGVVYAAIVIRRARRQTGYKPVMEDWLWHAVFPFVCYAALLVAAIVLPSIPGPALFTIAGAALFLVFIGIHNAWDTVTFVVAESLKREESAKS